MGKFFYYIIFFFICFVNPSFPQTFVKLFSDYLPKEYLNDNANLKQVENKINLYAKSNPDLIYYFINYLNSVVNLKIYNRDSNYFNLLEYEISRSIRYNNEWANEESNKIQNLSEPELVIVELQNYMDEFRISESNASAKRVELFVDPNLQKFFSYKCLTKDTSLTYNKNIDYENLVEEKIKKMFLEISNSLRSDKSNRIEERRNIYLELLQFHIFSKGFCGDVSWETEADFVKFLISLIDYSEFREAYEISFGYSAQALFYNSNDKVVEEHLPFEEFTFKNDPVFVVFNNLATGFRIKLKEYKSEFSHLMINAEWSFTNSYSPNDTKSENLNKYVFKWEGEPTNFTRLFNGTLNSVSWKFNKFSSFTSNIKVPIYYVSLNLNFELGLYYKYLVTEYSVLVYRNINDQTSIYPNELAPEIERFNRKLKKNLFGGSVTINYLIMNSLDIEGIISTFPSVQLGLEYFLPL